MNKLFTKIAGIALGLSMAIGVGAAVVSNSKEAARVDAAETFTKVTAAPSDWSGTYLIAYVSNSTTANVWTGVDANSNFATATITNGKITQPTNGRTVTIASMSGGYSIRVKGGTNDGKYISGTSGSNTTNFNTSAVANTLTYSSGVDIASNTSHFVFNSTSGTTRFRYYKSTTYSGNAYKKPDLFKLDEAKTLSSIALSGTYPTTFTEGDTFSSSGMTVTATYSDSTTANVTSSATFSGYNMSTTGNQIVTVSYTEGGTTKTATYGITVSAPKTPASIALSGTYQTEFAKNATFNHDGLIVTATYTDNTQAVVTGSATFSTPDMSTAGTKTITVTYTSNNTPVQTSYTITVLPEVNSISLNKPSTSIALGQSETLVATVSADEGADTTVTWSTSDNTIATVSNGVVTASSTKKGSATITATAGGKSATCTVNVIEAGVVIDLDFPVTGQGNCQSYSSTWTATNNGYTVSIYGANNNNSGWDHIRLGSKNDATTATVTTPQVSERLTSVVVCFDTIADTSKINSASLVIADNSDFTDPIATISFKTNIAESTDVKIKIPNNTSDENLFYKLVFDLDQTTNNGEIHITQIKFKAEEVVTLDSLTVANYETTYYAGSLFTLGASATITANYSNGTTAPVPLNDEGLVYTLNGVTVTPGVNVPVTAVGSNKTLNIEYIDEDENVGSITLSNITINYKSVTSISLDQNSVSLYIGDDVTLVATVTDEFADKTVTWVSSDDSVAEVDDGYVLAMGGGTAVISARAAGYVSDESTPTLVAKCTIEVNGELVLAILNDSSTDITDSTVEKFTGDSTFAIEAFFKNFGTNPSFSWNSSNKSVATITENDSEYAIVTVVGAGSSNISVNVTDDSDNDETASFTISVTASGVTSLTLTSSVPSGALYDGTYNNTLTLTPAVTLVGNATGVINWSSSDTNVATVSSASTTAPTGITVTGVGEGTATITAASVYTPSRTATFDVTVTADGVTALSWTKRPKFNSSATGFQTIWAGETTLGDLMSQNGSDGIGVFTPTWKSTKSDSPAMGTGAHDVHIGLYDTSTPTSEATPLTSDYVFSLADNGKYVVAFYEGKNSTNNTRLSITKWRSVIESTTLTETFDYSSGGSSMSQSGDISTATITKGGSTTPESDSLRLGSNSATGSLTVTSATNLISKIEVWVKSYGSDSATLNVGTRNTGSISSSEFERFEFTFDDPVSSVAMSTTASKKRVYVQKVVITSGGLNDIGKSDDCLGLESFIDTNLHMSDYDPELHVGVDGDNWCKDDEHHYYSTAKAAFNALNTHQKSLFMSNSAYATERARLLAWAAANGESFSTTTNTLGATKTISIFGFGSNTNNMIPVIVVISMISVTAVGGYFFLRKRKED